MAHHRLGVRRGVARHYCGFVVAVKYSTKHRRNARGGRWIHDALSWRESADGIKSG